MNTAAAIFVIGEPFPSGKRPSPDAYVTGFANLLNGLALAIDGTVLLVGHPNKQVDAYSGSTAWENAFRARLYFDAPKGENAHTDADARQLTLPKANYARKGAAIDVRWLAGALVREDTIPSSALEGTRDIGAAVAANAAFLSCLDVATEKHRAVSHVPGVNYERVLPARKDHPLEIDLPPIIGAKGLLAAGEVVLGAVAQGDLTPTEGDGLMTLIERQRRLVEATELEARIANLEAQIGK